MAVKICESVTALQTHIYIAVPLITLSVCMIYTADDHYLRLFENPHPTPLPRGEGAKATIGARVEYLGRAMRALTLVPKAARIARPTDQCPA